MSDKVKTDSNVNKDRRKFFIKTLQGIGLSILGGTVWGAYVSEAKTDPLVLRPPGALKEEDFLKKCIKCGLCVEACKNRDSNPDRTKSTATLKLAAPGDHKPIGTPYFIPREIPCYMCEDIPCVPVCPSGALDVDSVSSIKDGEKVLDINKARMGVAVVDEEHCIAFWGIQCDACYRACPLIDEAIKLEYRRNPRTGKHAFLLPVVYSDVCTGCGLCEKACVTEKAAIYVLPRDIALGRVGKHYIKGWEKEDEERLKGAKGIETTVTEKSKLSPEEYLNIEDLLDEE